MCRTEPRVLCPVPANIAATADMPSHQLTRSMKPRLPRKLAASARINLNRYWHALEELMPASRKVFDESDCNAINENIDNERRLAAMQLAEVREDAATESPETMVRRCQPSDVPSTNSCQVSPPSNSSFSSFSIDDSLTQESLYFPRITSSASITKPTAKASSNLNQQVSLSCCYPADENQPPNSNGCVSFLR